MDGGPDRDRKTFVVPLASSDGRGVLPAGGRGRGLHFDCSRGSLHGLPRGGRARQKASTSGARTARRGLVHSRHGGSCKWFLGEILKPRSSTWNAARIV